MEYQPLFIFFSILSSLVYLIFCGIKIKANPKICKITIYPGGERFDIEFIRDILIRASFLGGSFFIFINIIYYGITGVWILPYSFELSRVVLFIGGIFYIFFIIKGSYDFIVDRIKQKKR